MLREHDMQAVVCLPLVFLRRIWLRHVACQFPLFVALRDHNPLIVEICGFCFFFKSGCSYICISMWYFFMLYIVCLYHCMYFCYMLINNQSNQINQCYRQHGVAVEYTESTRSETLGLFIETRSIWKMLGPFATASRRIAIHQVSLLSHAATVARCLRIDVHNNNDNNDNAWQRGPLWPHRMGPIIGHAFEQLEQLYSPWR